MKCKEEPCDLYKTDYKVAPYNCGLETEAIKIIAEKGLLNKGGVIFTEHSRENSLINLPSSYIIDTRHCGNTSISFITVAEV